MCVCVCFFIDFVFLFVQYGGCNESTYAVNYWLILSFSPFSMGVTMNPLMLLFIDLFFSYLSFSMEITMNPLMLLLTDLFCLSLPSVWGLWWIHLFTWHARQRGFIATASHRPVPDDARDVGRTYQSLVLWATRNDKVKNEAEKMQTIGIINPVNQTVIPFQSKKHYFLVLHSSSHSFFLLCYSEKC